MLFSQLKFKKWSTRAGIHLLSNVCDEAIRDAIGEAALMFRQHVRWDVEQRACHAVTLSDSRIRPSQPAAVLQILLNSMGVMEEEQLSHPRCFSTPNIVGPSATFQRAGGACIYTTSNSVYGSRYPTEMRPPRFGLSNKFSKSVGEFPRLEISGPDSKITPFCRYMYGTTDWTSRMG